jgi:hypothetical protein
MCRLDCPIGLSGLRTGDSVRFADDQWAYDVHVVRSKNNILVNAVMYGLDGKCIDDRKDPDIIEVIPHE